MSELKYLPDLAYWIQEREAIRINKEVDHLLPPWTDDRIMSHNRWCNVRRENDKVTKWIFSNFLPGNGNRDEEVPIALCIARLVNWPDTLKELGYPTHGWTPNYKQHWFNTFALRRVAREKMWTGAYMVTGGYSAGGEPKEVIIARVLDGAAAACEDFVATRWHRLQDAATALEVPGLGPFLVAQVIADLKNTGWLSMATDWFTWCAPGPGSTMGLNFIHGRDRAKAIPASQFRDEVNDIRAFIARETDHNLCAQNTQNCLCELSKYIRAKYFNESLKNTYTP